LSAPADKLFFCYVPGIDGRRVDAEHLPVVSSWFKSFPRTQLTGLPSVALCSTLMTGNPPHEHGVFQTMLRAPQPRTPGERIVDALPNFATILSQLVRHQLWHNCDLPTLPPRRRRQFELHRLKFRKTAGTAELRAALRPHPSILDAVGLDDAGYRFTDRFDDDRFLVDSVAEGTLRVEILQFHAIDMMGHWYLDTQEELIHFHRRLDALLERLAEKCRSRGITMVLVSDHGQERVHDTLDLKGKLRALDLPHDEYAYFMQAVMARFWFRSERAREAVRALLEGLPHGTLLDWKSLGAHGIAFPNDDYGELFYLPDPGWEIFPDDFHHPLIDLTFGLTNWQERKRLRRSRHIASHGYLPHHPSEQGFMLVLDDRYTVSAQAGRLIDVAPTLLSMLGIDTPTAMTGESLLRA